MNIHVSISAIVVVTALAACGSPPATPTGSTLAASTFKEQVDSGAKLYASNCASCHGASGEGTDKGPRVVGLAEGALPLEPKPGSPRAERFVTAADVAGYVVKAMPKGSPGSLHADDYYSILAFDLHANGVNLDKKLGPDNAPTVTIPR